MLVLFRGPSNHINKSFKQQLKKIRVNTGLFLIGALRFTGHLIIFIFRLISGFFRLFFKDVFYKVLSTLYFQIFRLKKSETAIKALAEINRNQLAYWLILAITLSFVVSNINKQYRNDKPEMQLGKTLLASQISNEFSNQPNEELSKDSSLASDFYNSKAGIHEEDSFSLDLNRLADSIDASNFDVSYIGGDGDLILKPVISSNVGRLSGSNGSTPAQRTEIVYHTVNRGDTVSSIARAFGISVNTILWANNLGSSSYIRPGDRLTILPESGLLYTVKSGDTLARIANKYDITIDKIIASNNLGSTLKIGEKLILPGARLINENVAVRSSQSSYNSGLAVIQNLINPGKTPTAPSGKMVWPTEGHRITQYFSWRHNGLDIANKVGTPIYAADDGVVEISAGGWNGGYGNTILLNHGGGKKTRYGHASKLLVKVGQTVEKGQMIALMGSTGRSTGSHLHFEVLIGRTRYNPLNYIK